jgi:hypothetical protein
VTADFEIQTLINEQAKKDELFSETKRAKDDAMYKVSSALPPSAGLGS